MSENIIKKIGDGIVDYAPTLGAVLTASGVGAPVGAAINALAQLGKAFGLGSGASPEALATAMLSDPEARLKLVNAENSFKLEVMREQFKDIASARSREVETTKATGRRDFNMFVLAWVVIGGWLGAIGALIVLKILVPDSAVATDPILSMLFGSLSTNAGIVVGYFFGSSRGSDNKNSLLAGK